MAEEGKDQESKTAEAKPAGGGLMKLVPILALVNTLAALGAVAFGFMAFQKTKNLTLSDIESSAKSEKEKSTAEAVPAVAPPSIELDKFIINLASESGIATMSLEIIFDDQVIMTEVDRKKPQMRDIIINAVSAKTVTSLSSATGRNNLKEEIRAAINGILTKGRVTGVFYVSFYVNAG